MKPGKAVWVGGSPLLGGEGTPFREVPADFYWQLNGEWLQVSVEVEGQEPIKIDFNPYAVNMMREMLEEKRGAIQEAADKMHPPAAPRPRPIFTRIPFKCPVCNGAGHLNRPPWVAGDQPTWSGGSNETHPCQACGGRGVLWQKGEVVVLPFVGLEVDYDGPDLLKLDSNESGGGI